MACTLLLVPCLLPVAAGAGAVEPGTESVRTGKWEGPRCRYPSVWCGPRGPVLISRVRWVFASQHEEDLDALLSEFGVDVKEGKKKKKKAGKN